MEPSAFYEGALHRSLINRFKELICLMFGVMIRPDFFY